MEDYTMQIERSMSKGQVVALSFFDDGLTGTAVAMAIDSLVLGVSAPWDGCILAMAADTNAVSTHATGTVTFKPTINTTISTAATCVLTYNTVKNYTRIKREKIRFAAGDVLGVTYAVAGGYGPTSIDGQCTLFVEYDLTGV
jgi:hypothetical protein